MSDILIGWIYLIIAAICVNIYHSENINNKLIKVMLFMGTVGGSICSFHFLVG